MALEQRDIVAAARAILDEYGLTDLSMRRIATALGVQPGALYWHFANKQSLLAALADDILVVLPEPDGPPGRVIDVWARCLRSALLGQRDGAELVASVLAMRLGEISPIDHLAALLTGPDPRLTAAAVTHFVLGHCFDEQGHTQLVALGVGVPDDIGPQRWEQSFDHGLGLLVAGAERVS